MKQDTTHFTGRFLSLLERDGWEFASRSNASGVVVLIAVTDMDEIVLVEQFRTPVGSRVIELPAGLVGDVDDTMETTLVAAARELEEENIRLIGSDSFWIKRLAVDYYQDYRELNLWYIFLVEDVQIGSSDEVKDARWLDQTQDVWYPRMREKIFLAIKEYVPDLVKVDVSILESW